MAFEHAELRILRKQLGKLVDFGGEDEVAFSQSVDFMSPDGDLDFAPAEADVRMMSLFFGELTDLIYKLQRFTKIREAVVLFEMMLVDDFPPVELVQKLPDFLPLKRWHSTAARHALFTRQFAHIPNAFFRIAICPA